VAYFLGIDGGGTKTLCAVGDESKLLATATAGPSNVLRAGEAQARESLHQSVRQACAAAGIAPAQVTNTCIGAAGAARPEVAETVRRFLAEILPSHIHVVGDMQIALEAAFGAGPGVLVIAGTGSIAYGRDAAGRTARAGGWGFAVSDEGSGYWIGRRAVSAILNARDQGLETPLTVMLLQSWKLTTIDELVQQANSTPPPDFPRLFPIVLRAADEGDSIARALLSDAGTKLAELTAIVVCRLAPHAPADRLPVAMTGSVFRQSSEVRQAFYNALQRRFPGIDVRQDLADPLEGALARARAMPL
jgi:N-acetylglucosamine kinase-like BadF-type ATPase